MGIMFGPAAYLWIVLGTIFAGAVHDYISGMISLRADGASLPEIVGRELGSGIRQVMRAFSIVLLILVGGVFVVTTSGLVASLTPDSLDATFWAVVIFIYYLMATMFPVDKLIGNIYPLFAVVLLFMAVGLVGVMLFGDVTVPDAFASGLGNHYPEAGRSTHPVFIEISTDAVHLYSLRCDFRLPRHAVAHDGTLHEKRTAGTPGVLRRHGGGGYCCPHMGSCHNHLYQRLRRAGRIHGPTGS